MVAQLATNPGLNHTHRKEVACGCELDRSWAGACLFAVENSVLITKRGEEGREEKRVPAGWCSQLPLNWEVLPTVRSQREASWGLSGLSRFTASSRAPHGRCQGSRKLNFWI